MNSPFKEKLLSIKKELNKRNSTKEEIFNKCVSAKLDRSYNQYEKNLLNVCQYILSRKPIIMMKDFNKEFKEED